MPQLDLLAYNNQLIWINLFMLVLLLGISLIYIPYKSNLLKFRSRLTSFLKK